LWQASESWPSHICAVSTLCQQKAWWLAALSGKKCGSIFTTHEQNFTGTKAHIVRTNKNSGVF
jgi:hypothetical protein